MRAIVGDRERSYASVIPAIRRSSAIICKLGFSILTITRFALCSATLTALRRHYYITYFAYQSADFSLLCPAHFLTEDDEVLQGSAAVDCFSDEVSPKLRTENTVKKQKTMVVVQQNYLLILIIFNLRWHKFANY